MPSVVKRAAALAVCFLPLVGCDKTAKVEPSVATNDQDLIGGFRWVNGKRTIVKWDRARRRNLTYCLSEAFDATERARVRNAMLTASGRWESSADVDFHDVTPAVGRSCDPYAAATVGGSQLQSVFFFVVPAQSLGRTKEGIELDAKAFYPFVQEGPDDPPLLQILRTTVATRPPDELAALLTHELGHVLGFLHEHSREGCLQTITGGQLANLKIDGTNALTIYDPDSIMHYGLQCGRLEPSLPLALSNLDRLAVACVYGLPGTGSTPAWCQGELWDVPGPEYAGWAGTWTHTLYGPITP